MRQRGIGYRAILGEELDGPGPYGFVFVVDTLNNRIQKFDPEMNFVSKWGTIGREEKQFQNPSGIWLSWEPDWEPKDE